MFMCEILSKRLRDMSDLHDFIPVLLILNATGSRTIKVGFLKITNKKISHKSSFFLLNVSFWFSWHSIGCDFYMKGAKVLI